MMVSRLVECFLARFLKLFPIVLIFPIAVSFHNDHSKRNPLAAYTDVPSDTPYAGFMLRANQFYEQKDYAHALTHLLFAKDLAPELQNDFRLNFKIAYSYKNLHQPEKALPYWRTAAADTLMGDYAFFQLAGTYASFSDSTDRAIDTYKQLLQSFPNSVFGMETRITLIQLLNSRKRFNESDVFLSSAASAMKTDKSYKLQFEPVITLLTGWSHWNRGRYQQALDELRTVINNFRYTDEAYHAKQLIEQIKTKIGSPITAEQFIAGNEVLVLQGHFQEALNELAEAKVRYPSENDQKDIDYAIAKVYNAQGLFSAAVPRYQALWNKYRHKEALFNLAKAARYSDQLDLSINAYQDYLKNVALNKAWKNYIAYEIANNYSAKGDTASLREANRWYRDVQKNAQRSTLYGYHSAFREAFNHYKMEEYNEAVGKLQSLQHTLPFMESRCRFWIAKSYEKMNRKKEAQAIYVQLATSRYSDYYGMLSAQMLSGRSQVKNLFDVFPHTQTGQGNLWSALKNEIKPRIRTTENDPFIDAPDEVLRTLEPEFTKAWIGCDVLDPTYAERELLPLKDKYYASFERTKFLKSFSEYIGGYNLAVDAAVKLRTKYKKQISDFSDEYTKLFYPRYYIPVIRHYAHVHGLDENLLLALVKSESAFRSNAISSARAVGLMQIMPFTGNELARQLNLDDFQVMHLQNPESSIRLGSFYLYQQAQTYQNYVPAILGAYNAGPHRATFWMKYYDEDEPEEFPEIVELLETGSYIRKIMLDRWIYSQLYAS